jgi:uncharacterized protein
LEIPIDLQGAQNMQTQEMDEISSLTRQYGGEWGINHTKRLLHLIEEIGGGIAYDREIVWLAAHLHDWGAYPPWAKEGVDHALRSGEVAVEFLNGRGYPEGVILAIVECIQTHHQGNPDRSIEAVLLSDADALDFLGVVGILRDFAKKPKAMREAYETSKKRRAQLPGMLCLERSHQIAAARVQEMDLFLERLREEAFECF